MTPMNLHDLRAPYEYVVAETHIREVQRLLVVAGDGAESTSITLAGLGGNSALSLFGLGREVWTDVDPVANVRNLRDEWEAE